MKKIVVVVLALCFTLTFLNAQDNFTFGDISEAELKMMIYDADSNAAAVVLHDYHEIEGEPRWDKSTGMTYYRHVRIKILNPSAFDLATINLPYSKRTESRVGKIRAVTANLENGKIVKTEITKDDIFEEKLNKKDKVKTFTFPNLKVGSVIEYEYYRSDSAYDEFRQEMGLEEQRISDKNNETEAESKMLNYLISSEAAHTPDPNYFQTSQFDVSNLMRAILVDWMMEVCSEYTLKRETFDYAVNYVDRFLSVHPNVVKEELQLVGVSSMFIAAKIEEVYSPRVTDFAKSTDNGYNVTQIINMRKVRVSIDNV